MPKTIPLVIQFRELVQKWKIPPKFHVIKSDLLKTYLQYKLPFKAWDS